MARTFFTGFDAKDSIVDIAANSLPSGVSYETTIVRTGAASLKFLPASASNASVVNLPVAAAYGRMWLRFTVLPATARTIAGLSGSETTLKINPDGTIGYYATAGGTLQGTSTTALTNTGRFYRVEWRSANGTSVPILVIDGVTEVTGSPSSWTSMSRIGCSDLVAATYTMYVDDLSIDDAATPGDGGVALLLPISDNARASLWTGGSGGTTSLFDAVDNTPPVGTATETNTTQIEHAGGAAGSTDDYSANMTTYATAGIIAGSTINAVRGVIAHGEDSGTGTKLLTFSIASNPAQGAFETNFTAGADAGALGTYPTTWTITRGTIISSPSVTVTTSPVMTVRRPETASRVASVCFMGIYVDYTLVAKPYVVSQAVPRASLW